MVKGGWKFFIFIIVLFFPLAHASAGTILSAHKYAWSDNIGYINFANVIVDTTTLSGYAWSANKGFIKFNPTMGGVFNDGAGNLSGSAWGEQLGWISFANVSINLSTGKFTGTATSTLVGTITFDCSFCDVRTDWNQAAISSTSTPPVTTVVPTSGGTAIITSAGSNQESSLVAQARSIDIQKDGIFNIIDSNIMMVNWGLTKNLPLGASGFNPADMNRDGVVDMFDFNILMVNWGRTYQL